MAQKSGASMMNAPNPVRFSIVMPAYKSAPYLATAIESALAQTYPAHEIIVVDDCSPDAQAEVAARYPVTYLKRPANGGPAAAINDGIRASSGDYIALMAADDSLLPGRLAAVKAALDEDPGLDIITTDAFVRVGNRVLRRYYSDVPWPNASQRCEILERCFIFGAAVVRRDRWLTVGGAPESRDIGEDWPLWVKLIMSGSRAACVMEPLYNYQLLAGSHSDRKTTLARTFIAAMEEALRHDLSDCEFRFASAQLAKGRRDLALMIALLSLYGPRPARRDLIGIARNPAYRKQDRGTALFAAVAPAIARRALPHPDFLPRVAD